MRFAITVQLPITLRFDREARVWVAGCPQLAVFSQGETETQAMAAAKDALTLFVKHCYQRKILDDVLNEHGFRLVPPPGMFAMPPDPGPGDGRTLIDVSFFVGQQAETPRRGDGSCPS